MAVISLLFLAVMYVVHHPLPVSDRMDLDTLARSRQLEKRMSEEMRQLEMEFEERKRAAEQRQKAENLWRGETLSDQIVLGKKDMGRTFQADDQEGPFGWMLGNLWNAGLFCLFLLFELLRQNMQHEPAFDTSSDEEEAEVRVVPVTSCSWFTDFPSGAALNSFYEHCVQNATRDLPSTCEFVESFVDNLIEACRMLSRQEAHLQFEDCLGLGAAFEKWGTYQETQKFNVLVPIVPPQGWVFVLEMRDPALGQHCGRVLVELECMCKCEKLLGDVLCLVHHDNHLTAPGKCNSFIRGSLCTGSYLDVCKTVQWFRNLVGNAWALVAHKYDFKLSFPASPTSCELRLDYRSGRFLSISLVLGVQREDTLVYLVSQASDQEQQLTSVNWPESFAACEHLFLKLVGRFAPENTCHLKCLQIIVRLWDLQNLRHGASSPILTSYHFKTALMHLLLRLPLTDWQHNMLSQRLQDILWYLGRGLQERSLHHFLIGNTCLPLTIPIPKTFRNAEPVNLFQHLVLNPVGHSQAVEEFHNLLIQVKTLPSAPLAEAF